MEYYVIECEMENCNKANVEKIIKTKRYFAL